MTIESDILTKVSNLLTDYGLVLTVDADNSILTLDKNNSGVAELRLTDNDVLKQRILLDDNGGVVFSAIKNSVEKVAFSIDEDGNVNGDGFDAQKSEIAAAALVDLEGVVAAAYTNNLPNGGRLSTSDGLGTIEAQFTENNANDALAEYKNNSVVSWQGVVLSNSSSYGGSGAAIEAVTKEICDLVSTALHRTGWSTANVVMGAAPFEFQYINNPVYYLSMKFPAVVASRRRVHRIYVRVISGSILFKNSWKKNDENVATDVIITPGDGAVCMQVALNYAHQYTTEFQILAAAGAEYVWALPADVNGSVFLPVNAGVISS